MEKMEKIPISVVIPTMNRAKDLEETLESYMTAQGIPMQIVIVDQSEKKEVQDRNRVVLQKYKDIIECLYLYQKEPSLTRARNKGFEQCKYDLICCSDDDITVKEDTLIQAYKLMKQPENVMLAGLDENAELSDSPLGYLFGRKNYRKRKYGHVTKSMFGRFPNEKLTKPVKTEWAMGYFFFVKKSCALEWNLKWDEKLHSYAYAEDLDYTYSYYKYAVKEQKKCIMHPEVSVFHRTSEKGRIPSRKSTMMLVLNREYLSYKHSMGIISRLATRWANLGEVFLRIVHKSDWRTVVHAQWICDKNRASIRKGVLLHEWYEE